MKKLLLVCLATTLLTAPAFASEKKDAAVANLKQQEIAEVDTEIGRLQRLRSCLESATSKNAIHQCRQNYNSHADERKQQRIDNQQERLLKQQEHLDERKKKLEEKEQKLNQ